MLAAVLWTSGKHWMPERKRIIEAAKSGPAPAHNALRAQNTSAYVLSVLNQAELTEMPSMNSLLKEKFVKKGNTGL